MMRSLLIALALSLSCCTEAQLRPWEYEGLDKSAMAVYNYIEWARNYPTVSKVEVSTDSLLVNGLPAMMVTITVFIRDTVPTPVTMIVDYESLNHSLISISDTTYVKEKK